MNKIVVILFLLILIFSVPFATYQYIMSGETKMIGLMILVNMYWLPFTIGFSIWVIRG